MNAADDPCNADPVPFQEPLEPLPVPPEGEATRPTEAPTAVETSSTLVMEPETYLPPEGEDEDEMVAIVEKGEIQREEVDSDEASCRPLSRWKFWKRPSKRDQQLETLRQGACEMVGLMRSIRDHLEVEQGDRDGLRKTLSPLPVAVESLKTMSEHQATTGKVLGELRTTMERRATHDGELLESLNRIGETMSHVDGTFARMDQTLSGIDRSNQRAMATFQQLGERVEGSDRFMNETFARLRDAEREFTDYVTRSSRRGLLAMTSVCCVLMVSVLAVGFMFKENRELLSAVQRNGALVVQVPEKSGPDPARMTLLEELQQVEDGIGEPERVMVQEEDLAGAGGEAVVPVEIGPDTESDLLSVNGLPKRK